jgi:hypothetical protein
VKYIYHGYQAKLHEEESKQEGPMGLVTTDEPRDSTIGPRGSP